MKSFLAILFSVFFTFSVPFSKNAFSYSNPWDCVNDKNADYLTIIKDVEKDMLGLLFALVYAPRIVDASSL